MQGHIWDEKDHMQHRKSKKKINFSFDSKRGGVKNFGSGRI